MLKELQPNQFIDVISGKVTKRIPGDIVYVAYNLYPLLIRTNDKQILKIADQIFNDYIGDFINYEREEIYT